MKPCSPEAGPQRILPSFTPVSEKMIEEIG